MKTILVDDMLLDLQLFELKCADMPDFEIVGKFTDPQAAIEYASGHVVDFALLDIDMPGMDGIQLAQAAAQRHHHRLCHGPPEVRRGGAEDEGRLHHLQAL